MDDKKDNRMPATLGTGSIKEGFLGGSHIAFVFKKAERLATAIYLISNLWDEREPLKWKLRDRNLCLLETSSKYNYSGNRDRGAIASELIARMAEIVSLLEVSFSSGLLSEMNLRLIREEYMYLIKLLEEKESALLSLSKNFFEVKDNTLSLNKESTGNSPSLPPDQRDVLYKGHKGHVSDKMSFRNRLNNSDRSARSSDKGLDRSMDERRATILALVKSRGEVTVKDVASVIKGYSEKTVQRELLSMAAAGILKKKGERRWSRYSIK